MSQLRVFNFIIAALLPVLIFPIYGIAKISYDKGNSQTPATYRNDEYGNLSFRVPAKWISTLKENTISFTPEAGKSFIVMATPLVKKGDQNFFLNHQNIWNYVESKGIGILDRAVESKLEIKEFKGNCSIGYFYSLTDKEAKPGEWKYLTQGAIGVGPYLLYFTILTHSLQSEEIALSIDMFGTFIYSIK